MGVEARGARGGRTVGKGKQESRVFLDAIERIGVRRRFRPDCPGITVEQKARDVNG